MFMSPEQNNFWQLVDRTKRKQTRKFAGFLRGIEVMLL